jgi:NAD(P)-dependent dehydrogenase (short-subunit alcohol dehydrogenase family)
MQPLKGKVAVVAGATRGAGRGIACVLGEAGATVYCTGRSVRGKPTTADRPETIEETAERVSARGGVGIYAQVDHTVEASVKKDPHFAESETPFYIGRAVAALAADPNVMEKSGRALATWNLAPEYGFTDVDGRQPNWEKHYREQVVDPTAV